jgi:HlyD family secretion protein
MKRGIVAVIGLAALAAVGWAAIQRLSPGAAVDVLYGNVEIRQVDLSFEAEGKAIALPLHEGDRVMRGMTAGELDPTTYQSAVNLAEARRDAAKASLDVLLAGTRPEQIDQARANYALALAALANAEASFARQKDLAARAVSSQQQLDDARMALDSARARVAQTKAAMDEAVNGPRAEDIAAARANLRAAQAMLDLALTQLAHTRLTVPSDGTVMTRVVEPGTIVLPGAAVYSVAIDDEVWVRAFAPEPLLARLAPGAAVTVTTDGGGSYPGRVGYVSPAAEFTPKTVETPELRTQLVYRLRIRVENPDSGVRQGMPVTIHLPGVG